MPGTARMSRVPGDALLQIKGKNSLLLGKQSPCMEQKSHGTKRGLLQRAAKHVGHQTSDV